MSACCITVPIPAGGTVRDLLDGRAPDEAFTVRERRLCAERTGLAGWAGRLAAKRAVLSLLGRPEELTAVEIVPGHSGLCADPARCTASHPPRAVLSAELAARLGPDESIALSISHANSVAVAMAVRLASANPSA